MPKSKTICKYGKILFELEIGMSIEEAAKLKKVKMETITRNLRQLGYSTVNFRMWEDFQREKERLIQLCMNGTLSGYDFDTRYNALVSSEIIEPMSDPIDKELECTYLRIAKRKEE